MGLGHGLMGWGLPAQGEAAFCSTVGTKELSPPRGGWQRPLRCPLLLVAGKALGWKLGLALAGTRAAQGLQKQAAQLCLASLGWWEHF